MPESTLSLTYDDLRSEVGYYLAYGRDSADWDDDQEADIDSCVKTGLRWFYFPTLVGRPMAHDWRFLQPAAVLSVAADVTDYDLPSDFASLIGDLYHRTTSTAYCPVPVRGEAMILRRRGESAQSSGKPQLAAVRPKATQGVIGQRHELLIWPTPDQAYSLNYRYRILPEALDSVRQYPYGGAAHAETIKAAVIAAAEEMIDDMRGIRFQSFMERLAASISQDGQTMPDNLGYNADRSDWKHYRRDRHDETSVVTYDGFR